MLYTNLGFRDNVKALYDYIVDAGYNKKYQIVCSTNDYRKYVDDAPANVKFVSNISGILYYLSAGYVFYCFGKLPIFHGKDQKVVQMWHGCTFKYPDEGMLKGHSFNKPYYTNVFAPSRHFFPTFSFCFSIPEEQIIVNSQPRCDALFKESPHYDFGDYKKLILWAPTFRKSQITGYCDTNNDANIVPVLKYEDFKEVNDALQSLGVKIVVKLHPMQDLSEYHLTDMNHFILLSHKDFVARGMDLYRLMVQTDALISDYSSIFFDYMLLDRPMAFTEDDMDNYSRGFVVKNPKSYQPGFRIKTKDDLLQFAKDLAQGIDNFVEDRKRVALIANDYRNGNYCERALNTSGINLDK